MKIYSIFDDFSKEAIDKLTSCGIDVDILPKGQSRPQGDQLNELIHKYDGIIISTAQKVTEDMLLDITEEKIIATASIGTDHIKVPDCKKHLIKVVNAPIANRISVAEYVIGMMLVLGKNLVNARNVSADGGLKSQMTYKPHDLLGKTVGIVGTGGIGLTVLQLLKVFNTNIVCFSNDSPERKAQIGEKFVELDDLLKMCDVVIITLPLFPSTSNLISKEKIGLMKEDATFISISHSGVVDTSAAIERAKSISTFKVGMDVESKETYPMFVGDEDNIIITPHIAGATVEARERMFKEVSENICKLK